MFFCGMDVAIYDLEGIGMILPLESEIKDTQKFGRVLGLSIAFIIVLYRAFGTLGYFAFGKDT